MEKPPTQEGGNLPAIQAKAESPGFAATFLWLLLRLLRIRCSRLEVNNRRYEPNSKDAAPTVGTDAISTTVLDLARELYASEAKRTAVVHEKGRTLLTVAGLLIPLLTGAIPFVPGVARAGCVAALILLVITVYLLTEIHAVGVVSYPNLGALVGLAETQQKAELLANYEASRSANAAANCFLVDLYRAARRAALIALVVIMAMGTMTAIFLPGLEDRVVLKLRSHPDLIRVLQGPVGPVGRDGLDGPAGPEGPQGLPGLPGTCDCPPRAPKGTGAKP
ncbi:MAG: hypothetical protein A3J79_09680 [Elusimicrobia bacterium RIFOXYB2_FULL_62_6]|nr:MAG: hypothetical protein A3J79_09680 [Elusimicrobia bacterium RIFOXYB2_FULL_62_6]